MEMGEVRFTGIAGVGYDVVCGRRAERISGKLDTSAIVGEEHSRFCGGRVRIVLWGGGVVGFFGGDVRTKDWNVWHGQLAPL